MNFHEEYRNYNTIDLLKITIAPAQYMPEAVQAAEDILASRNVTPQERDAAEQFFAEQNVQKALKEVNRIEAKEKALSFLDPLLGDNAAQTGLQVRLFLFFAGLVYAYRVFTPVYLVLKGLLVYQLGLGTRQYILLLSASFLTVIYILMVIRRKAGWIIMAIWEILQWYTSASLVVSYLHDSDVVTYSVAITSVWNLLWSSILLFGLWQTPVAEHYDTTRLRRPIGLTAVFLVALRVVITYIYARGVAF